MHTFLSHVLFLYAAYSSPRLFSRYRDSYSPCLLTLSRHGSRLSAVAYRIIDGADSSERERERDTPGATKVTSREPCPKLVSVHVSFPPRNLHRLTGGFRWFSFNTSCVYFREK